MVARGIRKGFTLLELLFVVTIVLMTAGSGLVYVNNFSGRNDVELAAKQLKTALMLARNYAVTYQRPVGYNGNYDWVVVSPNTTSGVINIYPNSSPSTTYPGKQITLSNMTLAGPALGFAIDNGSLVTYSSGAINFSGVTYTLTSQVNGRTKQVVVQPHGLIQIQ